MSDTVFSPFATVKYEGPESTTRWPTGSTTLSRVVMGKPLKEHLRFAVAYWHSLAMTGSDPFGGPTIHRPWMTPGDPMRRRRSRPMRHLSCSVCSICRSSAFMTRTCAPAGRHAGGDAEELPHHGRLPRREDADVEDEAAVGHGEPVFASALSWLALRPTLTPKCSPGARPR